MCRCSDESMNYLLLDCDIANGMGIYAFSVFGIQCIKPRSVGDLLFGWRN